MQLTPAVELTARYHQRWEIENTLDEIKTHQGGRELVLRSQYPDGVEQEIYGFLLSTTLCGTSYTTPPTGAASTPTGSPSPAP
ncbi:hypothetical protein [Streptomyces flavidovirens]